MQLWWVALVIGVVIVLIGLELARRNRRASAAAESYYGPLPEREAERAELNDPAQFGQVTPGAVTPASAGSSQEFYEATGVGNEGPRHLGGPPPATGSEPSGAEPSWPDPSVTHASGWEPDPKQAGGLPVPMILVAGAGAAVGLGVFAFLRHRMRRRSRVERLREQARKVADVAAEAASAAGGKAAELPDTLPDNVDPRMGAGGLALVAGLALFAALRRRQQKAEAQRRAAVALEAARRRGRFRLKLGSDRFARQREAIDLAPARRRLPGVVPTPVLVIGGLCLLASVAVAIRRAGRPEMDWTGADVADAAPARERPASGS
jgi:hypothetical protein